MGRIIQPESAGKERTLLAKGVVLAIRQLVGQTDTGRDTHDLVAYIILALEGIESTIDATVVAWEKRDYWVKADKFRMEWVWAGQLSRKLYSSLSKEDWEAVALITAQIAQHLQKITIPPGHRLGKPWIGAWEKLHQTHKNEQMAA